MQVACHRACILVVVYVLKSTTIEHMIGNPKVRRWIVYKLC